ncbi:hypothetical protein Leryth_014155 [Lithospermum erythrorhizon]|nr:hypothetical protein Leryth_014155 [Lithospermum erythrorhizon]
MGVLQLKFFAILRQFMVIYAILVSLSASASYAKCTFEGIFNFGDSNSDTGGFWAAFPACPLPNGMTYFKKPAGRATDGRLIIDFLAQGLGLPFLSPYLQSTGSDFRHGVNFATLASTVLLPNTSLFVTGISPFSLAIQLQQMKQFKHIVDQQPQGAKNLPSADIFERSLYTFHIGQNDFTSNLASLGISGVKKYLPQVVSQISSTIKELYGLGGRTFLILNLAPIGCYPSMLVELSHKRSDLDAFGCMKTYNNAVVDYNSMLKEALRQTSQDLPKATVIYVDTHAVLLELFQHPQCHGLRYGTKACCGYGGGEYNFDQRVFCAATKVINGKNATARACPDPQNYVSWDGVHATEAANKVIANAILNGSLFEPRFSLQQFCDIQPIG